MTRTMRDAVKFFAANAGYCTPPGRMACAKALALAEACGDQLCLTFEWTPSPLEDGEYQNEDGSWSLPNECYDCLCRDASGRPVASLGGIGDPSDEYTRVVEAELAQEALDQMSHEFDGAYA